MSHADAVLDLTNNTTNLKGQLEDRQQQAATLKRQREGQHQSVAQESLEYATVSCVIMSDAYALCHVSAIACCQASSLCVCHVMLYQIGVCNLGE